MDELSAPRYNVNYVHFTQFFSVTKLDLVIQAMLLDYILALGKKPRDAYRNQ